MLCECSTEMGPGPCWVAEDEREAISISGENINQGNCRLGRVTGVGPTFPLRYWGAHREGESGGGGPEESAEQLAVATDFLHSLNLLLVS